MPFVRIQSKEGRTPEQKETLAKAIIESMIDQGYANKEAISVIFEDMAKEDFYSGEDY